MCCTYFYVNSKKEIRRESMGRSARICVVIFICVLMTGLCRIAVDPSDFTGKWYSATDQSAYLFQEGLIYCSQYSVALSGTETISGAYSFGADSIFLFAEGIPGLEEERELFLVTRGAESCLCENRDGTGTSFFIRYNE